MNRLDVISRKLGASEGRYLEIGVMSGFVFWKVRARTKIGVDPAFIGRKLNWISKTSPFAAAVGLRSGTFLFSEPSDDFFEQRRRLLSRVRPDCVLVDGLHTADQAYRDVEHALDWLAPNGLIVMHDCNPQSLTAALPSLAEAESQHDFDGTWNGTTWKGVIRLRTRSDLNISVLDCDEGLGIVTRGTPDGIVALSDDEIAALSYEDLCDDRVALLNLMDP